MNNKEQKELNTWQIAKIIVIGFCETRKITIGWNKISKAIDDISKILNSLLEG